MRRSKILALMILTAFTLTACADQAAVSRSTSTIENYLPEISVSLNGSTSSGSTSQGSSSVSVIPSVSGSSSDPESSSVSESSSTLESSSSSHSSHSSQSPSVISASSTVSSSEPRGNTPVVTYPQTAALFYNMTDNTLIESENADEYIAPASLLKLLTASVALHHLSSDTVVTVGSELGLVPYNSSLCLISKGQRLKLYDLLTGMLLSSGNDAAYTAAVTTARAVSGEALGDAEAVKYFADLMNAFAEELGMSSSHFVNPDGYDDSRQYTTGADLLLLARYALTVPEIREITSTYQKHVVFESGENITWTNTNKLLAPSGQFYCADAIGLKTGTTLAAGYNLIAAFDKDETLYIVVVSGCKSDAERYRLATDYYSRI